MENTTMNTRLFVYGLAGWVIATLALRLGGQHVLRSNDWKGTVILFVASFALMAWLMRRLFRTLHWQQGGLFGAMISLWLPTLLLDPFSSAFFPFVFPNIDPSMAGVFGGWMLCCCAGAFLGVGLRPQGVGG
jgi:Family of unknown function (DUF5367)